MVPCLRRKGTALKQAIVIKESSSVVHVNKVTEVYWCEHFDGLCHPIMKKMLS